jgi:hypothetical protein
VRKMVVWIKKGGVGGNPVGAMLFLPSLQNVFSPNDSWRKLKGKHIEAISLEHGAILLKRKCQLIGLMLHYHSR